MRDRGLYAPWLLAKLGLFAATSPSAAQAKPDPAVQKSFEKLLAAVEASDRDAFVAEGTDAVKEGTTAAVMDLLKEKLGSRLKKGYESTYLCVLNQAGHRVHLWKCTFKDGGDDMVIRVAIKDGKVAGFFLQ